VDAYIALLEQKLQRMLEASGHATYMRRSRSLEPPTTKASRYQALENAFWARETVILEIGKAQCKDQIDFLGSYVLIKERLATST
jgi:hypothetical protein